MHHQLLIFNGKDAFSAEALTDWFPQTMTRGLTVKLSKKNFYTMSKYNGFFLRVLVDLLDLRWSCVRAPRGPGLRPRLEAVQCWHTTCPTRTCSLSTCLVLFPIADPRNQLCQTQTTRLFSHGLNNRLRSGSVSARLEKNLLLEEHRMELFKYRLNNRLESSFQTPGRSRKPHRAFSPRGVFWCL